jgi:hypothetical protein
MRVDGADERIVSILIRKTRNPQKYGLFLTTKTFSLILFWSIIAHDWHTFTFKKNLIQVRRLCDLVDVLLFKLIRDFDCNDFIFVKKPVHIFYKDIV